MYFVNSIALWCCFLVCGCFCANSFQSSEFIRRIYGQSDSSTVCFIAIDDYDNDGFLTAFMRNHFEIPVSILTTSISSKSEEVLLSNAIVVLKAHEQNQKFLQILESLIGRLRVRKFVIVFTNSLEDFNSWCLYFWKNKFSRIYGMSGDECYAYLPFANNQIQEIVCDNETQWPNAMKDLNGFKLRTSLQRDIPRSFPYPERRGRRAIGGSYGQVFVNFLKRLNATSQEIIISNSTKLSIPSVINATIRNEIDISMNVFTPTPGLDFSYTVKYVKWNILVPINGFVDPNEYFTKPFSPLAWLSIGVTFVYVILMGVLKNILLNLSPNVWISFSQTMLTMLNLSPEKQITLHYCFHIQVLFLSFILGKLYNIYFTSFLTIFIKVKQFDTIQDLIDNNVSVMIPYYEWALISRPDLHPEGFEKIVVSVDYVTYITEMNSMRNTNYAYGVGSDRGEFLIDLQTFYAKPLFHSTWDGLVDLHLGFLLAKHSPFTEILSSFIMEVMDTGLIYKWDDDAIVQAIKAGFEVNKFGAIPQKLPIPLTWYHLYFAWNCLVVGYIVAVIVFVGELWMWYLWRFHLNILKFCSQILRTF